MDQSNKTKYLRKLIYWRPVREVLHTSRLLVIPGFQGIPLFDVAVFFIKGLMKGAEPKSRRHIVSLYFGIVSATSVFLYPSTLLRHHLLCGSTLRFLKRLCSRDYLPDHRDNHARHLATQTQRIALCGFHLINLRCFKRH